MKKILNWKEIGQFVAILIGVFTVIRDTLKQMAVGIEIFEWLIGDGKEFFIENVLKSLGEKFITTRLFCVIDENTIRVNLNAPITFPFRSARVKHWVDSGWLHIEKRGGELYADGRKIILNLSAKQLGGRMVTGYEICGKPINKNVLHPNVLDALIECPTLIPESWKKDEKGNKAFIFFWGIIFCDPEGNNDSCVRHLYFDDNKSQWMSSYDWLCNKWFDNNFTAIF